MKGNDPNRLHTVTIKWSNPILWENINQYNKDWNGGFYYITRIIHKANADYETPIYRKGKRENIKKNMSTSYTGFEHTILTRTW